jgi:hypothetical protein
MKTFVRLSVLLAIAPFGAILGSLAKTYTFSSSDITIETVEIGGTNYHEITLEDCYNDATELGNPSLPVMNVVFILNPDEKVDSVRITSLNSTTILTNAHPMPQQYPVPEYAPFVSESFDYYAYPSPGWAANVLNHGISAEAHIVRIQLCPVQFDPETEDLKLYTTIGISLSTSSTSRQTMVVARDSLAKERKKKQWEAIVENPDDVETCLQQTWNQYFLSTTPEEKMAIITIPEFVSAFERLAEWKTQRGCSTGVYTIPAGNYAPYYSKDVLQLIRDKVSAGCEYILLGGGRGVIPTRANCFWAGNSSGGTPYTDLYYADIDSDINAWDGNNNGVYTEPYLTYLKIKDIHFANDITGYLVGTPGGGKGFYTIVLKTTNGGATWDDCAFLDAPARKIYTITEEILITVGGLAFGLRRSDDGGSSWTKVLETDMLQSLNDVDFIDSDTGWAIGCKQLIPGAYIPTLLETTDGGVTWKEVDVPLQKPEVSNFIAIDAVSSSRIWIAAKHDVYRIDIEIIDEELHYSFVKDTPVEGVDFMDCSFFDAEKGIALSFPIYDGGSNISKVYWRDSDSTWTESLSDPSGMLSCVLATNDPPGRAYLFGHPDHVYVSGNSYGETWTDISTHTEWPPYAQIATFLKSDPSYIWVAGFSQGSETDYLTLTTNGAEQDINTITWSSDDFNVEAGDIGVAEWEPDVAVGRLPVTTVEEAELLVDKIITYEKTPPVSEYTNRALFMADVMWGDEIPQAKGEANGWENKNGGGTAYELYHPYDPDGDGHLTIGTAEDALNVGYNFVYHADHGGMDAGKGWIGTGTSDEQDHHFYAEDIAALTNGNKQSVLITGACWSANYYGWPYQGGCVATEFLRNPNGGGVAYIGSVYPSDPCNVNPAQEAFSSQLCAAAAANEPDAPRLGNLYMHALESMNNSSANGLNGTMNYHLLGDPSMLVWNGELQFLEVLCEKIDTGLYAPYLKVMVREGNTQEYTPVEDARVYVYVRDEYYEEEVTDGSGKAYFYPPPPDGMALVTVTKKNYKPHQQWKLIGDTSSNPIHVNFSLPTKHANTRNIAIDLNGNLHLVYTDTEDAGGADSVAMYAFSADTGQYWTIREIDPLETRETYSPSLALRNGITPYVAYFVKPGKCKVANLSNNSQIELDAVNRDLIASPGFVISNPNEGHVAMRTTYALFYRSIDLDEFAVIDRIQTPFDDDDIPESQLYFRGNGPAIGVASYEGLYGNFTKPFIVADKRVESGIKDLYHWFPGEPGDPEYLCAGMHPSVSVEGNYVTIAYSRALTPRARHIEISGLSSFALSEEETPTPTNGNHPQAFNPDALVWSYSDVFLSVRNPLNGEWTAPEGFGTSISSSPSADISIPLNLGACAWSRKDVNNDRWLHVYANTLDNFPPGSGGVLPDLIVTSPQAGDYWIGGFETIKWWQRTQTSTGAMKISWDGGESWDYITSNLGNRQAGPNYYYWPVGTLEGGRRMPPWAQDNCHIEITCGNMTGVSRRFTVFWNLCRVIPPINPPGGPIPPGTPQQTAWGYISGHGCGGMDLQISTNEGQTFSSLSALLALYQPSDSSVYDTIIYGMDDDTLIRKLYTGTIEWEIPNTPCTYNSACLKLVGQDTTGDTVSCIFGQFTIPIGECHENSTARNQRIMAEGIASGAIGITYTTQATDSSPSIIRYTETTDGLSLSVPDSIGEGVLLYSYWDAAIPNFSSSHTIADATGNGYIDYAPVGIVTIGDTVHTAILRRQRVSIGENFWTKYLLELKSFLKDNPQIFSADTVISLEEQIYDTTDLSTPSFKVVDGNKHVAFAIGDTCLYYTDEIGGGLPEFIGGGHFPAITVYEGNVAYSYLSANSNKLIRLWRYRDDATWIEADTFEIPDTIECVTANSGLLYTLQTKDSPEAKVCLYGPLSEAFYLQENLSGYNLHAQHIPGSAEKWYLGFTQLDNSYHFLSTRVEDIRTLYPALYLKSTLSRSPYTSHRDTCILINDVFVDYGQNNLVYSCNRLNPYTSYSVLLEFLCDADTSTNVGININGQLDTMYLPAEGSMWYETDLSGTSNLNVNLTRLGIAPITLRRLIVRHSDPVGYAMGGPQGEAIPMEIPFCLYQPFPNPFGNMATIRFSLPYATHVNLKVYDVSGRVVTRLVDGEVQPGVHDLVWNAKDNAGRKCASGVYFVRYVTEEYQASKKMVLIK